MAIKFIKCQCPPHNAIISSFENIVYNLIQHNSLFIVDVLFYSFTNMQGVSTILELKLSRRIATQKSTN